MPVDEIAAFRELGRPNRGVYTSGPLVGEPLPPHPLRFIDLPDRRPQRVHDPPRPRRGAHPIAPKSERRIP
jgi:hypothetical protein